MSGDSAWQGKTLIVTVGLPRSGKTTWAEQSGYPVVCPDAIRRAIHGQAFFQDAEELVWAHARMMVRSLFLAGHSTVVLDACSNSRRRRDGWHDPHSRWTCKFKLFAIEVDECIRRALDTGRPALIDTIRRMARESEPLGNDEQEWSE